MTHDPLCLHTETGLCACVLIARVRADERQREVVREVARQRDLGATVYFVPVSDPSLLPTLP